MKRAFLTLYLLIALSILGMGWALDQLWDSYQPEAADRIPGRALLQLVLHQSQNLEPDPIRELVAEVNASGLGELRLLATDVVGGSSVLERLESGIPVAFEDQNGGHFLYQKIPHQDLVLVVEQSERPQRWLETLLAVSFYAVLALVVFFWLWPLSRDLSKLERQALSLGKHQHYPKVSLPPSSTAHRLARAFNRMTERIRQLLQTQKEMTHAVSHELRTPLARMKFALEMVSESQNPEETKNRLEGMRADVAEMDQLINQLLNYARFEQQRPELNYKAGDMRALADELVQRLTANAAEIPGIEIHQSGEGNFVCDWPLMERALLNLIQNALHYARDSIEVQLYSDVHICRILVDDDGPGVPAANRAQVFDSFVRLRQASEKHAAGFGLGLAIVRQVSLWHGGEARVEQALLGGARFIIEWPAPHTSANQST